MAVGVPDENTRVAAAGVGVIDLVSGIEQSPDGHPQGLFDFVVGLEGLIGIEVVDIGRDHQGEGTPPSVSLQVVEAAESLGPSQGEAQFLFGLALCDEPRTRVARLHSSAGERHVPRPRIAAPLGAFNEKQFGAFVLLAYDHRDGGARASRVTHHLRAVAPQSGTDHLQGEHAGAA